MLKLLEQHPEYNQRQLAESIGLSLGKTNYVIHALMEKGLLKMSRFIKGDNKLTKAAYILTPSGIRERMNLTQDYVARKTAEYETLKAELAKLRLELPEAFEEDNYELSGKKK